PARRVARADIDRNGSTQRPGDRIEGIDDAGGEAEIADQQVAAERTESRRRERETPRRRKLTATDQPLHERSVLVEDADETGTWIVDGKPLAQPEIVPFRSAKMNRADVAALPGVSWNEAVLPLLTCPVGPCGPVGVVGMPTNPFAFTPSTWLTLVLPVMA